MDGCVKIGIKTSGPKGDALSEKEFSFYRVQTREQALARLDGFDRLPAREAALDRALDRVLAGDLTAGEDLPSFVRSTVDGFAVRAKETFGAAESLPALFELEGEVAMGRPAEARVGPGRAVRIWTGGMLPQGADAVVMLEYSRVLDGTGLELTKAVAPGSNTIEVGEDVAQGEPILTAGTRLRPQELGLLAALGLTKVKVVRRPKAAVISTGSELVPADQNPGPGLIRDVNSHTLAAQIRRAGGEPLDLGLVPDDREEIRELIGRGLERADAVLVSGGSSVGAADWTLKTFMSFPGAELLVHGVSISPGKPLILVRVGQKSLWGLPGHVASAMISFELFLKPFLSRRLQGERGPGPLPIRAELTRNLASAQGREDWVRVRLEGGPDRFRAVPVLGPSGLISTLVRADGLVMIDLESEGLEAGETVQVHLI